MNIVNDSKDLGSHIFDFAEKYEKDCVYNDQCKLQQMKCLAEKLIYSIEETQNAQENRTEITYGGGSQRTEREEIQGVCIWNP